jgi:hypothetical protein
MSSAPDTRSNIAKPCNQERRPPEGEFFLMHDEFHTEPIGWGEVLCSMGSGTLFCEINSYGQRRKVVLPKESARWEFFKTREACLVAWEKKRGWRPK